jgi:hypothetical protein
MTLPEHHWELKSAARRLTPVCLATPFGRWKIACIGVLSVCIVAAMGLSMTVSHAEVASVARSAAISPLLVSPAFPPGAEAREARLLTKVGPQTRAWIQREGVREAALDNISEEVAIDAVQNNFGDTYGLGGDSDVAALAFIVLMEASKSAQADLKSIMDGVKQLNDQKQALRDQVAKVSAAIDRRSKLMQALSNILKKTSVTDAGVTQNLK